MARPTELEMPSYIIYRDTEPGQPIDPTAPLLFFPAKDSDELFDALRTKYPHLKSHSERVREAVIEYLLEETQMEQIPQQPISTPCIAHLTSPITSQYPAIFPSASSNTSTWSSPEVHSLATSSFGESPPAQPHNRHLSSATSVTAPSEPSPPALEQMTGVFSLSDSSQPKQRVRRKMTEQEKLEYRKRRIVKACDKCSKRKRKCNHNQQDMESVSSKSHKMPRSSGESTTKKPPEPNVVAIPGSGETLAAPSMEFADPFGCELMQSFDNFGGILEAPLPDLNFDDFLASPQPQWPWTDTPDFTLMDFSGDSFSSGTQDATGYGYDVSPRDTLLSSQSESIPDCGMNQYMDGDETRSPTVWEHSGNNQQALIPQFVQSIQNQVGEMERAPSGRAVEQFENGLIGDGRRTTHSSASQSYQNNATIQGTGEQEVDMSPSCDSTDIQNVPRVVDGQQNLDVTQHRSQNIHTQLDRAKRRTDGIDASPMVARGHEEQNAQNQQLPAASQSPQSLSLGELGEGIIANTSPRTELFMLRRRIPRTTLHNIANRYSSTNATDSILNLQTESPPQSQTERHTERATVISQNVEQTDLQVVQANGNTRNALPQLERARASLSNSGLINSSALSTASRALETISQTLTASDCTSCGDQHANHKQQEFHSERLSDHVRRRDHFGRNLSTWQQVLGAVAGLGCLLMLLSLLPSHTSNLSLLLLALASPVRGAKGTHLPRTSRFCSQVWGMLLQETTKSSSWWALIDTRKSKFLQEREDTSSSTWVKETGHGSSWHPLSGRKEGGVVGA